MKAGKPEFVFVLPDMLGGVASFNRNIINYASLRDKAYVKVILCRDLDSTVPRFTESFEADEVVNFSYANHENLYAVLKRLNRLIGPGPGAVFCNEGIELESIYQFGTGKTVFQLIHDFYNIRLAVRLGAVTDVFLTHTGLFRDVLISSDPVNLKVFHLLHGVTIPENISPEISDGPLRLVFTGRLVEGKGVQDLYVIDQLLRRRGIRAEWTIIGRGALKEFLLDQWKEADNVRFASPETTEEVLQLMSTHDIFILPTRFEGSPVTILEALSTGLVPVVSDLPGGIREVVRPEVGRTVPVEDNEAFADVLEALHNDRRQLLQMRIEARKMALEHFDIRQTADNYFRLLLQYASFKRDHLNLMPLHAGFRLDQKWLPNRVVSFLRKGRFSIKNANN